MISATANNPFLFQGFYNKRMKKIVLYVPAILFLFLSISIFAQENKKATINSKTGFNLRTSLTTFLEPDGGIMLGLGYRWSNRFSAAVEPSWIFYTGVLSANEGIEKPAGIKLRGDIKYHFPKRNEKSIDFFIGPEFHYKSVTRKKEAVFGINCQNGQCAYFQQAFYTDVKEEYGGFIKAGMLVRFPFIQSDNLLLEIFLGLGAKQYKFSQKDLPIGGSFQTPPTRGPFWQEANEFGLPTLPTGFKVIFLL